MKIRTRFGMKGPWFAPNATISIIYLPENIFIKLTETVEMIRGMLPKNIADKLVCENSEALG